MPYYSRYYFILLLLPEYSNQFLDTILLHFVMISHSKSPFKASPGVVLCAADFQSLCLPVAGSPLKWCPEGAEEGGTSCPTLLTLVTPPAPTPITPLLLPTLQRRPLSPQFAKKRETGWSPAFWVRLWNYFFFFFTAKNTSAPAPTADTASRLIQSPARNWSPVLGFQPLPATWKVPEAVCSMPSAL